MGHDAAGEACCIGQLLDDDVILYDALTARFHTLEI
jgi:hypothetical protein